MKLEFLIVQLFLTKILAYQPYNETDPDYAASVYHLKSLVEAELSLLPVIYEKNKNGSEYLDDFAESNGRDLKQFMFYLKNGGISEEFSEHVVKHPLKSFRVIRRFVKYLKVPEIIEMMSEMGLQFPKESDLNVAMESILRLRQLFRFSVDDLIDGNLDGLETGSGITLEQIGEIADHAKKLGMFTHAIDFYEKSLEWEGLDPIKINEALAEVIIEHDKVISGSYNDSSALPPDSSPFVFEGKLFNSSSANFISRKFLEIDKEMDTFKASTSRSKLEVDMLLSPFIFEKLCKGEHSSKGKCYYSSTTHPGYLIGPLKVEVHSDDPQLIQIYDVLSSSEIEMLKNEVSGEMRLSRTATLEGTDIGQTSRFRTSANAWIDDFAEDKFKFFNERIGRITGLNVTGYWSSEIVQIAVYNPGGHYTPHSDAMFEDVMMSRLPQSELERGDRIMTFMIYLSDVEKGGGTGFPVIKSVIRPVKGSAVLWYNLNSDGTINYDMFHGGCPVLYGTKWIANKWIRSNDQMFVKKCEKDGRGWKFG